MATTTQTTPLEATAKIIGKFRWTICTLLFFATTVNYLDRQVLSLLAPSLSKEFGWSNTDYANITAAFQFIYAIAMLFAGRVIDKLGTKAGFTLAIIIWSLGAVMHAYSIGVGTAVSHVLGWIGVAAIPVSVLGFMVSRGVLAIGESGNFPAAIKATAEYFPKKERSLATGIFNSGSNVGAILAPLTVPWIAVNWGWQSAFLIIGIVGFLWMIFWLWIYKIPSKQKRLSANELEYINSDSIENAAANEPLLGKEKVRWTKLLGYRQTWAFAFGKFMTDGVWWFFLFWLPKYLDAQYGMKDAAIMLPLAVLYTMTMFGSIGGGWFPIYFIRKGYTPYDGRMKAMLVIALFPLLILLAQPLGGSTFWVPVFFIGIGASAHQAWSANIFTTVSDMFPKRAVGSVTGIGGMAGGIGGVLISKIGGWLFDAYKNAGIAKSWIEAKAAGLGTFVSQIQHLNLVNENHEHIDLNYTELGKLPKEAVVQLQSVDSSMFDKLIHIQKPLVQSQMSTAYFIMFAFCAVAYLIAWVVMKALVPKYKPIIDL